MPGNPFPPTRGPQAPFAVIFPALMRNDHERAFWSVPEHRVLIEALAAEAAGLPEAGLMLFVRERGFDLKPPLGKHVVEIVANAAQASCSSFFVEDEPSVEGELSRLGLGDSSALAEVSHQVRASGLPHVLVIDFRQAFLGRSILRDALAEFLLDPARPLVSAALTRDHPCQFMANYRFIAQDVLHLLEVPGFVPPGAEALPHRASRPFPFDWAGERQGLEAASPLFVVSGESSFETLSPCDRDPALEPRLWFRQAPDLARLLVLDPEGPRQELAGVFLGDRNLSCPALVQADGRLRVAFGAGAGDNDMLALMVPFGDDTLPAGWRALPEGARGVVVLDQPLTGAHGLITALIEPVCGGPYDLSIPRDPENAPWRRDGQGLLDATSGKRILGRQDFPPVYDRESGLAVFLLDKPTRCEAAAGPTLRLFTLETQAFVVENAGDAAVAASRIALSVAGQVDSAYKDTL